jgi:hypothetical protein
MMVVVPVMIMVAVVVAPGPVFFLFFRTQLAKIAVVVVMSFIGPLAIVDHLVVIPRVIVGVVRIINTVGVMLRAPYSCQG